MNKLDTFGHMLKTGNVVVVVLDSRRPDVELPAEHKSAPGLVLHYGLNMARPIPDLFADEEGISGTLSFNQCPVQTFVPWSAVYAMFIPDVAGAFWQDDCPPDVKVKGPPPLSIVPAEDPVRTMPEDPIPTERPRPNLRLVN